MTDSAIRITWLLANPEARETYKVQRGVDPCPPSVPVFEDEFPPRCMRCGTRVSPAGSGVRRAYTVRIRDRGSRYKNMEIRAIHGGCIPKVGEQPKQGLPARSLRASNLQAKIEGD